MSKFVKVVAAAAAGFVAGILLAPKSGKETRADIKAKADEVKTKATEAVGVAKEKATAGYEAAKVGATDRTNGALHGKIIARFGAYGRRRTCV